MYNKFMALALKEAKKAEKYDEVPIGAVIVDKANNIVARAYNKMEKTQKATAHAELLAIEKANKKLKSWRLDGLIMYCTIEPCAMCAGAIVNARIEKVYFGAREDKSGCAESKYNILTNSGLNHTTKFEGGIMEEECANIIKNYFKRKRILKKS